MTPVVYSFCHESAGGPFRPAIGRGATQMGRSSYSRPTHTGSEVKHIGEGFHVSWLPADHIFLMEVDADHWKTWVHQRLATPLGQPGSMSFFQAPPYEHLALAKHLTAETKAEEFIAGKGVVTRWERVRRQNHWFDALYNAAAAGWLCGVRLIGEEPKPAPRRPRQTVFSMVRPDGRPWIDMDDWRMRSYLG
jgi:hypothetical protein